MNDKRPLPIGMNQKVIGLFKNGLGGKITKAKTYTYLMDNNNENKKAKRIKKCIVKRRLMFKN